VVAPTRELAWQIYLEFNKYCKRFNVGVLPIFGGMNQHEVWKELKSGSGGKEIVVGTPGRLIDMIRKKAFSL